VEEDGDPRRRHREGLGERLAPEPDVQSAAANGHLDPHVVRALLELVAEERVQGRPRDAARPRAIEQADPLVARGRLRRRAGEPAGCGPRATERRMNGGRNQVVHDARRRAAGSDRSKDAVGDRLVQLLSRLRHGDVDRVDADLRESTQLVR
jgi:hypothetical protein